MSTAEHKKPEVPDDQHLKAGDLNTAHSSKSFVEQILSPQALQRMMACGGGLLVLGFVGWLWSIGLFENPTVVAAIIGTTTLAVLGAGIALVRYSRFHLAGSGMTLLASLAMPLNLWFYDAQGLITISDGGHLWIPAAIICAIYATVARVLRQPVFVYALVGGVVMTGMLFLADHSIGRFWELMPPVTFLIATGWICVLAERLFTESDGDFSRGKFGSAFHRAGLVVIAGGLLLMAGSQLLSTVLGIDESGHRLWELGVISITAIGFTGEYFLRKSRWQYGATAMLLGGWSVLCLLDIADIQLRLPHVAIVVAGAVIVSNLLRFRSNDNSETVEAGQLQISDQDLRLNNDLSWALSGALIVCALSQFTAQFVCPPGHWFFAETSWIVVVQLATTAAASWIVSSRFGNDSRLSNSMQGMALDVTRLIAASIATLAAVTMAQTLNVGTLDLVAVVGLLIPAGLMARSLAGQKPESGTRLPSAVFASMSTLLFCLALLASLGMPTLAPNITWGWILMVSSLISFIGSRGRERGVERGLAYLTLTGAICHGLILCGILADYALPMSATLTGLSLSIINALRRVQVTVPTMDRRDSLELPANIAVITGSVIGIMLALTRVVAEEVTMSLPALLVFQIVVVAITGLLTTQRDWRPVFRGLAVVSVIVLVAVINSMLSTHLLHRVELGSLMLGGALLAIAHIAWFREGDLYDESTGASQDESATIGLFLGSVMIAVPLAVGLVFYRTVGGGQETSWILFHEIGAILAGLALFGMGVACRIRWTTISGAGLLAVYLLSLLTLVQWPGQLKSVSVVMMVGGGLFFVVAVLLSIYRDRIVSLPVHIREGRGVFRVLRWR